MFDEKLLDSLTSKMDLFNHVRETLVNHGLKIVREDMERPWGGFFALSEEKLHVFKGLFFDELELDADQMKQKLSPKILIVEPNKRLSWQYHHRRAEIWKLVAGSGGIITSVSDDQGDAVQSLEIGKTIRLFQGERHRLIGLDSWGLVAEIWMHSDPLFPSDEDDIVRVQDDFARK